MIRASVLSVLLSLAAAAGVSAQDATPAPGALVRDARGEPLGRVEAVVADADGRPVQVIVRSRGFGRVRSQARALPFGSLRPTGDGFITPLRKSEFELLPPTRR